MTRGQPRCWRREKKRVCGACDALRVPRDSVVVASAIQPFFTRPRHSSSLPHRPNFPSDLRRPRLWGLTIGRRMHPPASHPPHPSRKSDYPGATRIRIRMLDHMAKRDAREMFEPFTLLIPKFARIHFTSDLHPHTVFIPIISS